MPAFDVARFHEFLVTREMGRNLIFEPSVGSTMDLARDAAAHGAVEGTVALADEQTAGRGRLQRSWVSPAGVNIMSTIVLRPPAPVLRHVAMIAPLAIAQAVDSTVGLTPDIKWPNDVLMSGKKMAGVLIENISGAEGTVVLVGTGINANMDVSQFDDIRDVATSIAAELGREGSREALFAEYLRQFEVLYEAAKAGEPVRDWWRDRLVTLGHRVTATTPAGVIEGIAEDVNAEGALLVRTDDGRLVTVEAGDVTLRA
jgi:BirA family biotin operon repressor/biotin-[acetyl-CoA-carboxylase] ligase